MRRNAPDCSASTPRSGVCSASAWPPLSEEARSLPRPAPPAFMASDLAPPLALAAAVPPAVLPPDPAPLDPPPAFEVPAATPPEPVPTEPEPPPPAEPEPPPPALPVPPPPEPPVSPPPAPPPEPPPGEPPLPPDPPPEPPPPESPPRLISTPTDAPTPPTLAPAPAEAPPPPTLALPPAEAPPALTEPPRSRASAGPARRRTVAPKQTARVPISTLFISTSPRVLLVTGWSGAAAAGSAGAPAEVLAFDWPLPRPPHQAHRPSVAALPS